jgi:hypothetical protein
MVSGKQRAMYTTLDSRPYPLVAFNLSPVLLLFMRRTATGCLGSSGVDCGAPFLYIDNFPFSIHNESGSIGNSGLGYENAVGHCCFAVQKVAQQGE